jgi:hypothetical protein
MSKSVIWPGKPDAYIPDELGDLVLDIAWLTFLDSSGAIGTKEVF